MKACSCGGLVCALAFARAQAFKLPFGSLNKRQRKSLKKRRRKNQVLQGNLLFFKGANCGYFLYFEKLKLIKNCVIYN